MGMFQNNMHSSANSLGNGSIIESSSPPNSTVNFDMINDFPALNNHQQHRPSSSDRSLSLFLFYFYFYGLFI